MPFVKLYTNLPKGKLPSKFMSLMCQDIAPILNKDPNLFNWIFETDKCMSKVSMIFEIIRYCAPACKKTIGRLGNMPFKMAISD